MILPLADALQNCLQNLTSRIAGMDNEQMTGRVMGMGAMLGFGLGAIKEQFKTPESKNASFSGNNSKGLSGIVSRAKAIINPSINLTDEKDYNGNVNPIRNVIPKESSSIPTQNKASESKVNMPNSNNKITPKNIVENVAKTGFNATKTYLSIGANMAEGNFDKNAYNRPRNSKFNKNNNFQNTEFINKIANNNNSIQKLGDDNEFNGKS